ncbi:hypothetical protein C7974DRAFT_424829 [Boeremia exigua]|uniref:uncharacterized protein n=1 Tax=Boeremia exigua TaxID=749465 RepID=UPI001E8CEA43|nr:uncharacterized protein C7974DRAFT_424829 [Boeremia exigua]KAH6625102.1 hypothetical protein C7974DRAFT_424829 [Boeremia exigua]
MNLNLDFKALAYPASTSSDPVSPCSCSLVFRCDAVSRQATVLLVARISTRCDTQVYALQYDANNLQCGTARLSSGHNLPQPQSHDLLRDRSNKHLDIKTLSFDLVQQCPLWCPDAGAFGPAPNPELVHPIFELAKATSINVVFDYKRLRKEHQGMFRAFSKAARGLRGYPCEELLTDQGLRKASLEVLSPVVTTGAPPPYDRSRQRQRLTTPSPPKSPPLEPAVLQSPTGSHSSEKTIPFSPAAAESLERALGQVSPAFDFQTAAINAAVRQQISAYLDQHQAETIKAALNREPLSDVINAAVSKYLEENLPTILPQSLERIIAGPLKPLLGSPVTSFRSFDSVGNWYPKLPPLTQVGKILIPHLRTHLAEQFRRDLARREQSFEKTLAKRMSEVESDVQGACEEEREKLLEDIGDQQADFALLKTDVMTDLENEIDVLFKQKLENFEDLINDMEDRMCDACTETCIKFNTVGLQRLIAHEVRRYERRKRMKKGVHRGVGKMIRGGTKRLLGKRRRSEDADWVDC